MGHLQDLVEEVQEKERPLLDLYDRIRQAVSTETERKLAAQMYQYQKFQIASLDLLKGEVPQKFLAFGAISDDDVNLRSGPGPRYELIARVNRGTPAILMEAEGNWVNLRLPDGTEGWLFKAYIKREEGF